ncbi:7133_t:CDS:2 [Paraglomus brasilianum]|uniref:7133_t:CDS:1 n=1 Tax=Paraglomus brasilianum TaxID=144538 RepID=A0A9N8ZCD5_9GLOM|nr:7133_t:CDS:2 [Paraglomus brasilianum]
MSTSSTADDGAYFRQPPHTWTLIKFLKRKKRDLQKRYWQEEYRIYKDNIVAHVYDIQLQDKLLKAFEIISNADKTSDEVKNYWVGANRWLTQIRRRFPQKRGILLSAPLAESSMYVTASLAAPCNSYQRAIDNKSAVKMVARLHDTFYDAKATLLTEADIKKIREKMANKLHIGPKRVYEIWDNKERLQQEQNLESIPEVPSTSTPTIKIPKKNGRKKKVPLVTRKK